MGNIAVLVAGAGPAGLTLASELARHGVAVRIVDKAAARTDKSKALVLWSRSLELFEQAGFAQPFLAAGMRARGAQMLAGAEVIGRVTLDALASRYPYALMIPQSETERILEEHLAQQGVRVEREVALESFVERAASAGGGVEARLRRADGTSETLAADWLAGCDGAHSTVRHTLGFAFQGTTQHSDWFLADGRVTGLDPEDRLHIFWHRDGILAFFPISPGRWRVIADLGPAEDEGRHADPTLEQMQALIAQRGGPGLALADPRWLSAFRINERKVARYGRGCVFLAGDAAHVHSPAGGQGMNTGMQDAFNLAWKLALVIQGICRPALLDSYSVERSAVGDKVLRAAGRATDAAVLRNPLLQFLRNRAVRFALGFPRVVRRLAEMLAELDIAYPDSPLSVTGAGAPRGPRAGARWPDPLPAVAGAPRFAVVGPPEVAAQLAEKFPRLVRTVPPPGDAVGLYLIRPDGYLGFAGTAGDGAGAERYLRALLR